MNVTQRHFNRFLLSKTSQSYLLATNRSRIRKFSSTPPPAPKKVNDDLSSPQKVLTSFCVGSFAGMLGSLAGMGGGFVMIPLMTSRLLGISQHIAHGTSLFAVASTGIAGAIGYGLKDNVDIYSAAAIASCGIVSARFGAQATTKMSEAALKRALGVFMICVAPSVPAKKYFSKDIDGDESQSDGNEDKSLASNRIVPAGIIGMGSGFLAGLFGVGGGAVVVPALTVVTDMSHYEALSTSLLAMTLPAISGTVTHFQKGNVATRVAFPLALGSFIGAYAGGRIGVKIPEDNLRWGFSALMFTLGTKTLLRI